LKKKAGPPMSVPVTVVPLTVRVAGPAVLVFMKPSQYSSACLTVPGTSMVMVPVPDARPTPAATVPEPAAMPILGGPSVSVPSAQTGLRIAPTRNRLKAITSRSNADLVFLIPAAGEAFGPPGSLGFFDGDDLIDLSLEIDKRGRCKDNKIAR
jgi:hypothetical protein